MTSGPTKTGRVPISQVVLACVSTPCDHPASNPGWPPWLAIRDVHELGWMGHGGAGRGVGERGHHLVALYRRAESPLHALVVTALLLGIGGGVALGAFAGARRTDTAMASFVSYSRPDDGGFIYGSPSGPTVPPGPAAYSLAPYGAVRQILSLPQVKAWFEAPYLFMATDPSGSDVGILNPFGFSTAEALRDLDRPLVIAGHLPDPSRPFDVAVNEFAADKRHLHVGSRFRLYAYSYPQIAGAALITQGVSKGRPEGPSFTVKVTGIVRVPTT